MSKADVAMLIDQSICVNCESCTLVCKDIYNTTKGVFRTKIQTVESGEYPDVVKVYNRKSCMHCNDAPCVASCPTKACYKNDDDLTVIDERTCIECNYCYANCPFQAITYDRSKGLMEKCSLCDTRIEKNLEPFCSMVCNTKAIKYGSRAEMMSYGNKRVSDLKDNGYEDAYLYGVDEMGGTRVFYVLQHSPEKYDLPVDPQQSAGSQIWKYLVSPFGGIAALAAAGALLFNYGSNKRILSGKEDD